MDDPVTYIEPERLRRLQRRYPIHWREILDMMEAGAIIHCGGAHPRFIRLACYRTWELMLGLYDLASPTEHIRQGWRRSFRQLLVECPQTDKYFPHFRQRLNEHKMFVKHGLEPLDPDEMEGGGKRPIGEEI